MKILCLADLHIHKSKDRKQKFHWIRELVQFNNIDAIVIAGDVFESWEVFRSDPYQLLGEITDNKIPVICCLGNHEFVDDTVDQVLKAYKDKYNPQKYNVHYLDICDHFDIGKVRFLGNVLWYDGSLRAKEDQNLYDWAWPGSWLDKRIIKFNYEMEHSNCIKQINNVLKTSEGYTTVLVTHCVPHIELNGHDRNGIFNAYSGVKNLLKDSKVNYSISGHTHKRVIGLTLEGCECVNIGNNYYPPYEYYVLEV